MKLQDLFPQFPKHCCHEELMNWPDLNVICQVELGRMVAPS
jgi:hypothetical protein